MNKLTSYVSICVVISLTACGGRSGSNLFDNNSRDPRSIHGIDGSFVEQITLFESIYGASIGDVSIGFSKIERPAIAICSRWSNGYRQITVDPDYWNIADNMEKISLMFHELGHCVLNREHVNSLYYYNGEHISGYVPVSFMYPYNIFHQENFNELKDYYFHEMFNPSSSYMLAATKSETTSLCVEDIVLKEEK